MNESYKINVEQKSKLQKYDYSTFKLFHFYKAEKHAK